MLYVITASLHKSTPSTNQHPPQINASLYLLVLEQPLLRGSVGQEVAKSIAECICVFT